MDYPDYFQPYANDLARQFDLPVDTANRAIGYALVKAKIEDGWGSDPTHLDDGLIRRISADAEAFMDDAAVEA